MLSPKNSAHEYGVETLITTIQSQLYGHYYCSFVIQFKTYVAYTKPYKNSNTSISRTAEQVITWAELLLTAFSYLHLRKASVVHM
jgi:hypothetical protein